MSNDGFNTVAICGGSDFLGVLIIIIIIIIIIINKKSTCFVLLMIISQLAFYASKIHTIKQYFHIILHNLVKL